MQCHCMIQKINNLENRTQNLQCFLFTGYLKHELKALLCFHMFRETSTTKNQARTLKEYQNQLQNAYIGYIMTTHAI